MTQLPSQSQFGDYGAWPGRDVLDSSGERLGDVREIYLDRDTGLPEWVLVEVEGGGARFVPLADAEVQSDTIRVAHSRSVVDQAPRIGDDPRIDERQEEELYDHYGIRASEDASSSVLPVEEPAPEPRADGDSPAPSGGEPAAAPDPALPVAEREPPFVAGVEEATPPPPGDAVPPPAPPELEPADEPVAALEPPTTPPPLEPPGAAAPKVAPPPYVPKDPEPQSGRLTAAKRPAVAIGAAALLAALLALILRRRR